MNKTTLALATALAAIALAGCSGSDNFRDTEGVNSHDADSYYLINNVDGHPNIVRVCQDGVAFATTTRDYNAIMRVPDWDRMCPKK